jgi:NIMA (never in mitosis gene a)-related kinase
LAVTKAKDCRNTSSDPASFIGPFPFHSFLHHSNELKSASAMSFKDFRVVEAIGKGSFASVYKVIRKSDNKIYALKRVKINKMSKKEIADALNEIRFLASIRQKNIVGFLEAFLESDETELCIVMEYCGCGDLAQKVERYKRRRQYIDENVIWRYLVQCLKALQHLHEKGICHRDLKAANTFLAEDGSIKIGDMNVSKRLQKGQLQTQIGTPYYMGPEIWNNRPYDSSADIWALGCMIYEVQFT